MPDYSKSKIYKIVDNTNGNVYIGSTTQSLSMRLAGHTQSYKRYLNGKNNYMTSFEIIKNGNYNIFLIEEFSCENKEQLHRNERKQIEANECVNKNIPIRTQEEVIERIKKHREDNLEQYIEYSKAYKIKLDEEYQQRCKAYYQSIEDEQRLKEEKRQYYLTHHKRMNEDSD